MRNENRVKLIFWENWQFLLRENVRRNLASQVYNIEKEKFFW